MQVMLTCECGQGLRTDVGQTAICVQCPSCGNSITVWPPAGAAYAPAQPKVSANAVVALVLGLCALVPIAGILTALPAIVVGIIVLRRKRPGRGFALAGVCTAVGSLLTIQVGTVLYAIMIYTMFTQTMANLTMRMPGPVLVSQPIAVNMPDECATDRLDADEVADALLLGFDVYEDANAASAALAKARLLYDSRELPGHRFECLRQYSLHLARRGRSNFADPSDGQKYGWTYDELTELVLEKYDLAGQLEADGDWAGAMKVYESIAAEVPAAENAIHVNALAGVMKCEIMASDAPGASPGEPEMLPPAGGTFSPSGEPAIE